MSGPVVSDRERLHPKKTIDKRSFEYIARSGLAGGLAGISAKTLIAPLDRVKILFQTNNPHYKKYVGSFKGLGRAMGHIYQNDGFRGLYQGHSATLLRIFPYAAIKFVCYEQIRSLLIPGDEYETAARRLLAGSLAGVISVYFTYPLDLIRVRLAFETNHHSINFGPGKLWYILTKIYNEKPRLELNTGGEIQKGSQSWLARAVYYWRVSERFPVLVRLGNFYRGFVPTIMGMVPYAGVSFYSHDLLHDLMRSKMLSPYTVMPSSNSPHNNEMKKGKRHQVSVKSKSSFDHRVPLNTWAQLLAGGLAGMTAQAAAYPFEVIRRRMQVGGVVQGGAFLGLSQTIKIIFQERGLKGFYVGLGIGFLKVVPMFACSFYVYERSKNWLL
ncbi:coenzyme A transporter [Martiniozyma asiatica (nom. inval.)]|nr:coenzyme A transporter [Martiniozyma asiatica]